MTVSLTVSFQRVVSTTSNGKVTNGRTPEEMDDIIRSYISGAVSFFFLYENTKLIDLIMSKFILDIYKNYTHYIEEYYKEAMGRF